MLKQYAKFNASRLPRGGYSLLSEYILWSIGDSKPLSDSKTTRYKDANNGLV